MLFNFAVVNRREWKVAFSRLLRYAQYLQEEGRRENATLQSLPFPPQYRMVKVLGDTDYVDIKMRVVSCI